MSGMGGKATLVASSGQAGLIFTGARATIAAKIPRLKAGELVFQLGNDVGHRLA